MIAQTIHDHGDVIGEHILRAPGDGNALWTSAFRPVSEPRGDLDLVGAMDSSRRRAIERSVGEAVERYAARRAHLAMDGAALNPSGIAAGRTWDDAIRHGLLELLERDAVMLAWACQTRLSGEREAEERYGVLLAGQPDSEMRVATCPSIIPGVVIAVSAVFSNRSRLCGFGAKAHGDRDAALRGAVFEAIQLRELTEVARTWHRVPVTDRPRTELERARYWSTDEAFWHLRRWFDSFTETEGAPSRALNGSEAAAGVDLAQLFSCVEAVAGEVTAVDFTPYLPPRVAELGWRVAQIVCPGLQPLVMDELAAEWNLARLAMVSRPESDTIPPRLGVVGTPHPVI